MYYSLFLTWRYVPKSLPILPLTANSLSNFHQYILNSTKFPLYEKSYESLLFSPFVQTENNFFSLSSNDLQTMPVPMVNKIFSEFLNINFSDHIIVYTDGSISPLSTGFSFYIPELLISFTNNLPPSSSSFTAECYAIIEALILISRLAPNNYLIASDSLSRLLALKSNPFNFHPSPLALCIKHITLTLHQSNYFIQFLWIPSHIVIYGNKVADSLAKFTYSLICPSLTQLPHTDFTPTIPHHIKHLWSSQWSNLPAKFATRYKHIVSIIPHKTWFNNLHLSRSTIIQFNRLRSGHTTLPAHAYKLDLNDSLFYTLHITEKPCDLSHILFDCPSLHLKRTTLFKPLKSLNISPNLYSILNSNSEIVFKLIITFILEAGFRI
uniref:RNase H type-1 domain-containing protein n=1 Tax=Sipha flava TaxID=143950 RepID=A0A2S2R880_9HEMI